MSGCGSANFETRMERELRLQADARRRIQRLQPKVSECRVQVQELLDGVSPGVRGDLAAEITAVKAWLAEGVPAAKKGMSSDDFNEIVNRLEDSYQAGQTYVHRLIDIKEKHVDRRRRELLATVKRHIVEVRAGAPLMDRWFPGTSQELLQRLNSCQTQIESDALDEATQRLAQAAATIQQCQTESETLQGQDEQRRRVLRALREVCREMGWDEEAEPRLEDSSHPGSDFIYAVDTYDAGIMTFRVSLERIQTFSPFTNEGGVCHREFSSLSERLKKFGVITNWEWSDPPDELPEDRARGELDLPDEGMIQRLER